MNNFIPKQVVPIKSDLCNGLIVLIVDVCGNEYDKANEMKPWCSNKPGYFGNGLINTEEDPNITERSGKIGEIAFAKIFHCAVDLQFREKGDKQDFVFGGKRIDIKTTVKSVEYGLVRIKDENNNWITLNSDIYVFAHIIKEYKEEKFARVSIIGYSKKKEDFIDSETGRYKECLIKPGKIPDRNGKTHTNIEMPYIQTRPIVQLYDEYVILKNRTNSSK